MAFVGLVPADVAVVGVRDGCRGRVSRRSGDEEDRAAEAKFRISSLARRRGRIRCYTWDLVDGALGDGQRFAPSAPDVVKESMLRVTHMPLTCRHSGAACNKLERAGWD